ncbi:MAG: biotin transporter BioY [Candidatus Paceibacterota bacterium]
MKTNILTMPASFDSIKESIFNWRISLSISNKIILSFGVACATGLLAQISIPLPWTPVLITGQTFAVLLSAIMLGKWWGGVSQIIYAGLGFMGVRWFSGWTGGPSFIFSPTFGYVVGFVLAAFFLGYAIDKIKTKSFANIFGLMIFADLVFIHGFGLLGLYIWLSIAKGTSPSIYTLFVMGSFPFILGDLVKIFIASGVAKGVIIGGASKEDKVFD